MILCLIVLCVVHVGGDVCGTDFCKNDDKLKIKKVTTRDLTRLLVSAFAFLSFRFVFWLAPLCSFRFLPGVCGGGI